MTMYCRGRKYPDNDNEKWGAQMSEDPLELDVKGLVISWQNIEGGRLLLVTLDSHVSISRYSIHAYKDNVLVARLPEMSWHGVLRFMHGALQGRGGEATPELWDTVVLRIAALGGPAMT